MELIPNFSVLLVSLFNEEALGLRQLYASLRHRGYNTKLMFFKLDSKKKYEDRQRDVFANRINRASEAELEILCRFVEKYRPDVIGISLVSSNFHLYKRLYVRLREIGNFKMVLGGWQASLNPESCMPYCDIVCVGEGDRAFPELVDRLYNKQNIDNIDNLWVKTDGKIVKNMVHPLNRDLDSLPNMVFDDASTYYIENNELINSDPQADNERYGIMTARGCPYRCTYCSNSYMANHVYPFEWNKMRRRSVDHVMRELTMVKARFPNVKRINFYDEVFVPDRLWAEEFFKRYKKEVGLPFFCMFYPGTCREDIIQIMRPAGLTGVWIGVQSGSERVRKEIYKRNYSNSLIISEANLFRKYGVSVRYDFILDNPFEAFSESLESVNLMLELPEPFSLNLFSLKYFPKTDITRMALDSLLIKAEDLDDHLVEDNHNYMITQGGDNVDGNFINHLAMYLSLLANKAQIKQKKESILKIICAYEANRSINDIKSLLSAEIREN